MSTPIHRPIVLPDRISYTLHNGLTNTNARYTLLSLPRVRWMERPELFPHLLSDASAAPKPVEYATLRRRLTTVKLANGHSVSVWRSLPDT